MQSLGTRFENPQRHRLYKDLDFRGFHKSPLAVRAIPTYKPQLHLIFVPAKKFKHIMLQLCGYKACFALCNSRVEISAP
jgi:hypothetical protein